MSDFLRLTEEELALWQGFLRAHHRLVRSLDRDLRDNHDITIDWYDVLYQISAAGGRLTMSELADAVLVTAPNCTRIVDRMVGAGLLRRETERSDARIRYAVLTVEGLAKLRESSATHVGAVREHFTDHVPEGGSEQLATLFGAVVRSVER